MFASKVLSLIFRINGHHWAGPTQLLPHASTVSGEQASEGLKTFSATLQKEGQIPKNASEKIKLSSRAFVWKEFRVATKNFLSATANSLSKSLPEGFSLKNCQPPNILKGAGITGERMLLIKEEKESLGMRGVSAPCMCVYDYKTHERTLDVYLHENFVRLVFAADEGTEVGGLKENFKTQSLNLLRRYININYG